MEKYLNVIRNLRRMIPELEQIARDTGEFFFSYKPLILTTMIAVPAAIGYGVFRLAYNPTTDKYLDKFWRYIDRITGFEERIMRRYNPNQSKGPEQMKFKF